MSWYNDLGKRAENARLARAKAQASDPLLGMCPI
jgi:hypothetical protein